MLDLIDATALTESSWNELPSRAELPCSWQEYAAGAGAVHTVPEDARKYCRIELRSIAIIFLDEQAHAAYTKDVSKVGLGFYSPANLLPRTSIRIWVPGRSLLRLRVARCRRLGERCFQCGGLFEATIKP